MMRLRISSQEIERVNVWIVQPYVPEYRRPLFASLIENLASKGVVARVVASTPTGDLAQRGDATSAPWLHTVRAHVISLPGRRHLNLTVTQRFWRHADVVVLPLQATSIDAWLAQISRRGPRRLYWGPVANYVSPPNWLDQLLERFLMRHSSGVLAYTASGGRFAIDHGISARRVTVLNNTIDIAPIEAALDQLSPQHIREFLIQNNLENCRIFAWIGALDASKRVDLFANVLDVLWDIAPDVRFIVSGSGNQEDALVDAERRGQIVRFSYAGANEKAIISKVAEAIVITGRIGLLAIDALALKLPIISARFKWHAPEVEYLEEGVSLFTTSPDALSMANEIRNFPLLDERARSLFPRPPGMDTMVERMASSVMYALTERRSRA